MGFLHSKHGVESTPYNTAKMWQVRYHMNTSEWEIHRQLSSFPQWKLILCLKRNNCKWRWDVEAFVIIKGWEPRNHCFVKIWIATVTQKRGHISYFVFIVFYFKYSYSDMKNAGCGNLKFSFEHAKVEIFLFLNVTWCHTS